MLHFSHYVLPWSRKLAIGGHLDAATLLDASMQRHQTVFQSMLPKDPAANKIGLCNGRPPERRGVRVGNAGGRAGNVRQDTVTAMPEVWCAEKKKKIKNCGLLKIF